MKDRKFTQYAHYSSLSELRYADMSHRKTLFDIKQGDALFHLRERLMRSRVFGAQSLDVSSPSDSFNLSQLEEYTGLRRFENPDFKDTDVRVFS